MLSLPRLPSLRNTPSGTPKVSPKATPKGTPKSTPSATPSATPGVSPDRSMPGSPRAVDGLLPVGEDGVSYPLRPQPRGSVLPPGTKKTSVLQKPRKTILTRRQSSTGDARLKAQSDAHDNLQLKTFQRW